MEFATEGEVGAIKVFFSFFLFSFFFIYSFRLCRRWGAPELRQNVSSQFSPESSSIVWNLAVILWSLFMGSEPYPGLISYFLLFIAFTYFCIV